LVLPEQGQDDDCKSGGPLLRSNWGEVRIDGKDIRSYKLKSLRQQISFVLQENLLFRATLAKT